MPVVAMMVVMVVVRDFWGCLSSSNRVGCSSGVDRDALSTSSSGISNSNCCFLLCIWDHASTAVDEHIRRGVDCLRSQQQAAGQKRERQQGDAGRVYSHGLRRARAHAA